VDEKFYPWNEPAERTGLNVCLQNIPEYTGGRHVADTHTIPTSVDPKKQRLVTSKKTNNENNTQQWTQPPNVARSLQIHGSAQWIVSRVIDCTEVMASNWNPIGGLYYRVDWTGWDYDDNWYPAENFKNCPVKLEEFHCVYPAALRRPRHLNRWHYEFARGIKPRVTPTDNEMAP